ncbi:TIGR02444 family protein [Caulobacter sp. SLTY]|uniref:TIGR02444 family protein n=1 Tax=Caulobacter sp. SLTY TaxID=2683262 RepID=UPI001412B03C|nr:TIGR02444 family protein [Caulobacter sp. SLTY]NBB16349.1 TIGR02444 family protein [Caulobacter sp. SLTY]
MSFWTWALAAYGRPGVAEACLMLQDDHGQQTAFLLWAAFADPAPKALADGAELARHWEREVLGPIRQARRALKPALPPVEDGARLGLREEVKVVELGAERLLMETLEALASGPATGVDPMPALSAAARAWGHSLPNEALQRLASTLA